MEHRTTRLEVPREVTQVDKKPICGGYTITERVKIIPLIGTVKQSDLNVSWR